MKLIIKKMFNRHSKKEVKNLIEQLDLNPINIKLGEVIIEEKWLPIMKLESINNVLKKNNYELVICKERQLIEKIKAVIIEMIYNSEKLPKTKYSNHISNSLGIPYHRLARIFSNAKQITIQKYIILLKIERVKQLILYDQLTLSEIAWKLQYSSTAHLSNQFKNITGLTPSSFKKKENKKLISLAEIEHNNLYKKYKKQS